MACMRTNHSWHEQKLICTWEAAPDMALKALVVLDHTSTVDYSSIIFCRLGVLKFQAPVVWDDYYSNRPPVT